MSRKKSLFYFSDTKLCGSISDSQDKEIFEGMI